MGPPFPSTSLTARTGFETVTDEIQEVSFPAMAGRRGSSTHQVPVTTVLQGFRL